MSTDLAYAAGLIDGEGCIHIEVVRKMYFNHRVTVGMTEPALPILQDMQLTWGGTLYNARKPTKKWAGAWAWHMTADPAATFLLAIKPYLRLKTKQAEVALEVWSIKQSLEPRWGEQVIWTEDARQRCRELVRMMHELNMKGPSRTTVISVEGI